MIKRYSECSNKELVKILQYEGENAKSRRGRARKRWFDDVKGHANMASINKKQETIKDQKMWKLIMKQIASKSLQIL